jgi:hypothetical protein
MCCKGRLPFSYLAARCFETSTRYLSVEEEERLSRETLETAMVFKRRVNVLLYQAEQKSKRQKLETRKSRFNAEGLSPTARKEDDSFALIKSKRPNDLKSLVQELKLRRQQKQENIFSNSLEVHSPEIDPRVKENAQKHDHLSKLSQPDDSFQDSKFIKSSYRYNKRHRQTVSGFDASDRDMTIGKKTLIEGDKDKITPLPKLDLLRTSRIQAIPNSSSERVFRFEELQGNVSESQTKPSYRVQLQLDQDASLRRLSIARQKVTIFH